MKSNINADFLRSVLSYDPLTGIFRWLSSRGAGIKPGDVAGGPNAKGYWFIGVSGVRYYGHRLAWLYMTGEWPSDQIDHKDLNKSNNAWENLRQATHSQNQYYKPKYKNNKSGFKGVHWVEARGKYVASIRENNKSKHIGYYNTPEEAHEAYCREGKHIHGEFWHSG